MALVKGNAMCPWRGMHLVMGGARDVRSWAPSHVVCGSKLLRVVQRALLDAASYRHIPGAHLVAMVGHAGVVVAFILAPFGGSGAIHTLQSSRLQMSAL